jgi:hypothetical protein
MVLRIQRTRTNIHVYKLLCVCVPQRSMASDVKQHEHTHTHTNTHTYVCCRVYCCYGFLARPTAHTHIHTHNSHTYALLCDLQLWIFNDAKSTAPKNRVWLEGSSLRDVEDGSVKLVCNCYVSK